MQQIAYNNEVQLDEEMGRIHALFYFNRFVKLSPVQLFENVWNSFPKQTTWMVDMAVNG